MPRTDLNDIVAFLAVARERSFTRAAAQLGVSQSALSQTVRGLEARLGLRLLTRTTRSVAPTEAGERLLRAAGPRLDEIDAELAALSELRDKPAGTIRITAHDHAVRAVLWPALREVLAGLSGHQGGDRHRLRPDRHRRRALRRRRSLGEQVAKDMIAVRIGPDMRMAVVGAPSYFAKRPRPKTPQDLTAPRLHQSAPADPWRALRLGVREGGRELKVRVEGQLVFNGTAPMLNAALAGSAWHTCPRTTCRRTSPTDGSSACSPIGARPTRATTSITRAAANPRRPSRCWSMRCAIGAEDSTSTSRGRRGGVASTVRLGSTLPTNSNQCSGWPLRRTSVTHSMGCKWPLFIGGQRRNVAGGHVHFREMNRFA